MQTSSKPKTADGWTEAQLLVAFHKDPRGNPRNRARAWSPKKGVGWIHEDPEVQETFVEVRAGGDEDRSLQIKLRRHEVVVTRPQAFSWKGVVLREEGLDIALGQVRVSVDTFGTVTWDDGVTQTIIDPDGTVCRLALEARAAISSDALSIMQETADTVVTLSERGFGSRKKSPNETEGGHGE